MTEPLTPEQMETIRKYLTNQLHEQHKAFRRAPIEASGPYGYIVRYGRFETFVGGSEPLLQHHLPDEIAVNEPLQAWYLSPDEGQGLSVSEITHDQYCDWLRRKES